MVVRELVVPPFEVGIDDPARCDNRVKRGRYGPILLKKSEYRPAQFFSPVGTVFKCRRGGPHNEGGGEARSFGGRGSAPDDVATILLNIGWIDHHSVYPDFGRARNVRLINPVRSENVKNYLSCGDQVIRDYPPVTSPPQSLRAHDCAAL